MYDQFDTDLYPVPKEVSASDCCHLLPMPAKSGYNLLELRINMASNKPKRNHKLMCKKIKQNKTIERFAGVFLSLSNFEMQRSNILVIFITFNWILWRRLFFDNIWKQKSCIYVHSTDEMNARASRICWFAAIITNTIDVRSFLCAHFAVAATTNTMFEINR